jgi:hypothetical protein
MRKSKYPQVPMPGEEPKDKRHHKPGHHDGPDDKKKKKKRKHHLIRIIILLVLLIGILLGILIDRGILFPGGQGWIGNGLESLKNVGRSGQEPTAGPIDINGTVTPNPTRVPTQAVNQDAPKVYLVIKNSTILMNDVEVTAEQLIAQLSTETYSISKIYLIDDLATKGVYENVQTILNNLGRTYQVGTDQ